MKFHSIHQPFFGVAIQLLALCTGPVAALLNPIIPGWNPDPSILRVGTDYFITTSTFEYFPGHPIYHSKNLVDWKLIGHALNRPSQLSLLGTPSDAGVWAPSLRYHDGSFYLSSTTRYVYTDSLGYDADLFWDKNGDVYSTWSGINNAVDKIYGIWQNKIDITTGNSLTPAENIFHGTLPNNSSARPEGPHVHLINGTYYLLIAEGGTGAEHRATIQRGPSPSGPWENNPNNPILFNGADLSLPVQATGHADIVQAPDGKWWGVALGVRPQNENFNHMQLGRETFLFPVTWESGWPVFNGGNPLSEHIEGVLGDKSPLAPYFNDFSARTLDPSFYFIRTPYKLFYTFHAGSLRLNANSYALGDRDSAALIVRKQTSYQETFETSLLFVPKNNLTEAGISIYYGDMLHNEIGITGDPGGGSKRFIVVRTIVQGGQTGPPTITTLNYVALTSTNAPVKLTIVGNSTSYSLGYAEGNSNLTFPATIDSSALSVAPAGGFFFKGVSFGVYNTGNGKPSLVPADFSYWKQTPGI